LLVEQEKNVDFVWYAVLVDCVTRFYFLSSAF